MRRGVVLLALLLAACGGGEASAPDVLEAGQLDIKLPPGWTVTEDGARRPARAVATGDPATPDASTEDTVPLAAEDPTTEFFDSANSFQQCLEDRGTEFRGVPDAANPDSPTNDPAYLEDLSTCAAKSNIVQTMQAAGAAQDSLTPAEIEEQNEGFLRFRECMLGRGWDFPKPKPDSKGRLFSFGGGTGPQMTPPAGETLLGNGDLQDCATDAQEDE